MILAAYHCLRSLHLLIRVSRWWGWWCVRWSIVNGRKTVQRVHVQLSSPSIGIRKVLLIDLVPLVALLKLMRRCRCLLFSLGILGLRIIFGLILILGVGFVLLLLLLLLLSRLGHCILNVVARIIAMLLLISGRLLLMLLVTVIALIYLVQVG